MENIKNEGNILKYKKVRKIIFIKDSETDNRTINGGYRRQWNKIYKNAKIKNFLSCKNCNLSWNITYKAEYNSHFSGKQVSVIKNTLKISERRNMFRVAASEIQKGMVNLYLYINNTDSVTLYG